MNIKTVARNGSNVVASLRSLTIGHAARILVTEVLQAGGTFVASWAGVRSFDTYEHFLVDGATGFDFATDSASFEFKGSQLECERFARIVAIAIKAGAIKPEKFDGYSQRIWMLSMLSDHEWNAAYRLLLEDLAKPLVTISRELDLVMSRHHPELLAA